MEEEVVGAIHRPNRPVDRKKLDPAQAKQLATSLLTKAVSAAIELATNSGVLTHEEAVAAVQKALGT